MAKSKSASKKPETKTASKAKNRKFFTYTNASLQAALQAIRENGISVREASRCFGIPRATLHDKYMGKSSAEKKKTGPPPLLTVAGERQIADWATNIAKCGFPISKTELMEAVTKISTDAGKSIFFPNGKPGIRWYKGFLKRHPEISQREAEGINKARSLVSEESIRSWFWNLRKYLEDNNFLDVLDDPNRIFNGDESGFSLCPKNGKVLGPKGWKNLYVIKSGKEKENITVLITFSASGAICPPLVVYPYVRPPKALIENVPRNWVVGKSDSGWMTGEVFFEYISNDFNSWLTKHEIKRPILLLIDGHKSHMTLPLSEFCTQHDIILYALPPNTTHILQPADVSVFKPMKQEWKNTVKNWQKRPENSNQIITKINFCKVFEETLQNTQMQNHIVKGFRKCGLYPFNPDEVDYTKCVKNFLEKNCQQQNVSASVLKQTFDVHDFDTARRVIEFISNDLKIYGVNVDIIITEIDFQKSLILEKDSNKIQQSTSTIISEDQALNIAVGSIVPMDDVTLLPVKMMEIEEDNMLLNFDNHSWNDNENSELEVFTGIENDYDIDAGDTNKKIVSEKKDHIEIIIETHGFCQNEIVSLIENEKVKGNGDEASIETEGDKKTGKEINNHKKNEKGNEKDVDKEIRQAKRQENDEENEKGNEKDNDKENRQANQQKYYEANEKGNEKDKDKENRQANQQKYYEANEKGNEKDKDKENRQANQQKYYEANEKGNEKDKDKENRQANQQKNDESNEKGNEKDNNKENRKANQQKNGEVNEKGSENDDDKENKQENDKQYKKGREGETYTKNEQTDSNINVILYDKIHDSTIISNIRGENAQIKENNKDKMDRNKREAIISDPFIKHLTFPEATLKKNSGGRVKEKLPSAISSAAWRAYYNRKDDEKKEKIKTANLKRKTREEKRDQKRPTKRYKNKATTNIKESTTQGSTSKDKVVCTLCEEELFSDAEEDENKNIGCDKCPRWYHLKCTHMTGLTYNDAARKDYICDICR